MAAADLTLADTWHEPLSPELVLVCPELRAAALARETLASRPEAVPPPPRRRRPVLRRGAAFAGVAVFGAVAAVALTPSDWTDFRTTEGAVAPVAPRLVRADSPERRPVPARSAETATPPTTTAIEQRAAPAERRVAAPPRARVKPVSLATRSSSVERAPAVPATTRVRRPSRPPSTAPALHEAPVLRWPGVPGATYYNVQLFRGTSKVLSRWPREPKLPLERRWTYGGRQQRLSLGVYRWYVWPGFGPPAAARFGKLHRQSPLLVGALEPPSRSSETGG